MSGYVKCLILLLLPMRVWADLTIFEVRKNLPMSDSDPVYRDFIINGGTDAGLSVGMVLTVQRRTPLYDSYSNRSAGDLQLRVARIKIIHAQKNLAVARLQSEFTHEAAPILDENYIMIGDTIDLSSATSGGDKKAESGGGTEKTEPAAAATPPPPPAASSENKTTAQIVVNSVNLSSHSEQKPSPLPQKVDVPVLQ